MKATVTRRFYGVRDGETRPVWHEPGSEVVGDLARVAVTEGWAKSLTAPANKALGGAPENKFRPVEGRDRPHRGKRAKPDGK